MSDPWFKADDKDIGRELQTAVQTLEMSPLESKRRSNLLYDLELYFGSKLTSLYEVSGGDWDRVQGWDPEQLVFNVCYSIVNTIRNRICSFRARAQWIPNGGDYKARRAARDRTAMSDSWAQTVGLQEEASLMLRDLLIGDGGVLKVYKDSLGGEKDDTVACARFPSWEFMFDEAESIYRMPECAYHVTYIPIELAESRYSVTRQSLAAAIVSAPPGLVYVSNRDLVRQVEAWKRGPGGRHVTVVGNDVVGKAEDWKYDGFPLVQRTFDEGQVGIWGRGAIHPIRGIQLELNDRSTALREAHRNSAFKYLFYQEAEDASKLLGNSWVKGFAYKNTPPTIQTPPPIHPQIYQEIELFKKAAYETVGISQFIAAGQKQAGLESAVAIREASELQTDRLANLSQMWETMRVDAATWWDRFSVELARAGVPVKWKAMHRGAFKELVFGDLEQEWQIQPFPSSVFGQSISGRLDRAVDLIKGGFMSKEDAMKALDMPDLAPIVDLQLAQSYAMEYFVDDILEEGKYEQPDSYIEAEPFFAYAKNRYFLALSDGSKYPADHMSLMRRLLDVLQDRVKVQQAAAAPQPQAPPTAAPPALLGASPEMLAAGAVPGQPQ